MARSGGRAFIKRLLAKMTLEEKVGQLTMVSAELARTGPTFAPVTLDSVRQGRVGSILNLWGTQRIRELQRIAVEESKLKIPLFFGLDVVHGYRTIFPISLGETCAFDPKLWEQTARAAAEEAAADGIDLTFAPMIDISRDPRWGRTSEGPGEDAWLASRYAQAKVRGFQSRALGEAKAIGATAKHLAGYGAVRAGLEYAQVDVSEREMHELYLPPFRAAVDAGVAAIMPAFIDLNGVPMTANAGILRDIVRDQWGFAGVMISDYAAVSELIAHGVAEDVAEAAALALAAGIDIDMVGGAYAKGLPQALERGAVTIGAIDAAVARVLELKAKLGLFDDPYIRCAVASAPRAGNDAQHKRRELAREAARRSVVLLKNNGSLLPLRGGSQTIAVIGPLAAVGAELAWSITGASDEAKSILDSVRAAFPASVISSAPGCEIDRIEEGGKAKAVELARQSDVVVLCLGETPQMSGEAGSRARPSLPPAQCELASALFALERPVIVLLYSGRPLVLPDGLAAKAGAIVALWFPGSEAGPAVGDILSGHFNPTGRLCMSWPVDVGQIPIFYGQRPTGRPASPDDHFTSKYLDLPIEPLFCFGHGLSYGRFELSDLRVDRPQLRAGETLHAQADIANLGPVAGEATIFLFTRDPVASIARPMLELKAFHRIALAPAERATIGFRLAAEGLGFLGPDFSPKLEAGSIDIHVGQSAARDKLLTVRVTILVDES
jgi:beta-glucosidase